MSRSTVQKEADRRFQSISFSGEEKPPVFQSVIQSELQKAFATVTKIIPKLLQKSQRKIAETIT